MGQTGKALGPFPSALGMVGGEKEPTCQLRGYSYASSQEEMSPCTGDRPKGSSLPGELVPAEESITV